MPPLRTVCLLVAAASCPLLALAAPPAEVIAGPPSDLSVTVYRAPGRGNGPLSLYELNGFALVSETRSVSIPPGDSEIRFPGVADGIESATALLTGLPAEVLEKNRDAQLLSPSELIAATVGKRVVLVRTDPQTGRSSQTPGTIRSDAGNGVVFESVEGTEALRCSGLPETFQFSDRAQRLATPTLSVRARSPSAVDATVTLSYLSRGFDWSANYVASLAPDGRSMDIGAWVTLANRNGTGFEAAHTQVVAGRLNRDSGQVEPIPMPEPILAQCWPQGTTSDQSVPSAYEVLLEAPLPMQAAPVAEMLRKSAGVMTANLVEQEQLGDLKLYRVPERTTVSSQQLKQVRLLDRSAVPVSVRYVSYLVADQTMPYFAARRTLQSVNDADHHLGLPLPSGEVASFEAAHGAMLLLGEEPLRDIAVGEELEIDAGASPDLQVRQVREESSAAAAASPPLPLLPGVVQLQSVDVKSINRIEIHNGRAALARIEIRLRVPPGTQIVAADHPVSLRHDQPVFDVMLAAGNSMTIRYRTGHTDVYPVPR